MAACFSIMSMCVCVCVCMCMHCPGSPYTDSCRRQNAPSARVSYISRWWKVPPLIGICFINDYEFHIIFAQSSLRSHTAGGHTIGPSDPHWPLILLRVWVAWKWPLKPPSPAALRLFMTKVERWLSAWSQTPWCSSLCCEKEAIGYLWRHAASLLYIWSGFPSENSRCVWRRPALVSGETLLEAPCNRGTYSKLSRCHWGSAA